MTNRSRIALTIAFCVGAGVVWSDTRAIMWSDLAPPVASYTNPFRDLDPKQLDGLRELLRLQVRIESGETGLGGEAAALRAEIEEEGLDVDWLFAKRVEIMEARRTAASGVNPDLIGQRVRIPGYLLPLEIHNRKAVEFLLVPTVGACIHTPPPPPNQLVHVRYPEGVEIRGYYDPIWIEGILAADGSVQDVRYVDGEMKVDVSYAMDAAIVERYRAE